MLSMVHEAPAWPENMCLRNVSTIAFVGNAEFSVGGLVEASAFVDLEADGAVGLVAGTVCAIAKHANSRMANRCFMDSPKLHILRRWGNVVPPQKLYR